MKIYIASSWRNQHGVEMLTELLRSDGHGVISWIENSYGEGHNDPDFDFEKWMQTDNSFESFWFDSDGAMTCDLFIYYGNGGKDAAAECGLCYGQRLAGKTIPMYALFSKGEDFGLMRKMFDKWFERYVDLLESIQKLR